MVVEVEVRDLATPIFLLAAAAAAAQELQIMVQPLMIADRGTEEIRGVVMALTVLG
jgi:hypothetical protein